MQLLYLLCVFSFCAHLMIATEYIYPVASYDEDTILYIHQTSPRTIQLFTWNTITNHTEQVLWSLFNPAGIQLLPNNSGFSFIDNGRLRIKLFQKRGPKAIDFDEPICNISGLHWIDEHTCYCSAQYNNYFSLFQLNDDGGVHCLISDNNKDCMYPQKINDQLFYIERNIGNAHEGNYAIMQTIYDKHTPSELIFNFYDHPIIFLTMLSEIEGFVIEYEEGTINSSETINSSIAYFFYHHLIKEKNIWKKELVFSFAIPIDLFLGNNNDQRLFESILPLLPRVANDKIYFVNYSPDTHNLELYYYDLVTKQQNKIPLKTLGHIFVPIICGTKIYYGGTREGNSPFTYFLT